MNVTKNKQWLISFYLLFVMLYALSGCSKQKIVTSEEYLSEMGIDNKNIKEYEDFMINEDSDNEDENKGGLEKEIQKYAKIKFDYNSFQDTGTISCTITAPDVYSYLLLNEKTFLEMESEDIRTSIVDACKRGDLGEREVTIIIPARKEKEVIIVDTSNEEYTDAVTGGLYSAISDIYMKSMQEIGDD